MKRNIQAAAVILMLCGAGLAYAAGMPQYTEDGKMNLPADYRQWPFLTSSFDLNYDEPIPGAEARHVAALDNIFVNPEAYRVFMATGAWPDNTVLVKENRTAESAGELSKSGRFQTGILSVELHVKDNARTPGKWAFFLSDGKIPARPVPAKAECFTCHGNHGAVDTTFVQFYPTLLEIAKAKGTLAAAYLKEKEAALKPAPSK